MSDTVKIWISWTQINWKENSVFREKQRKTEKRGGALQLYICFKLSSHIKDQYNSMMYACTFAPFHVCVYVCVCVCVCVCVETERDWFHAIKIQAHLNSSLLQICGICLWWKLWKAEIHGVDRRGCQFLWLKTWKIWCGNIGPLIRLVGVQHHCGLGPNLAAVCRLRGKQGMV